ncbi:AAA+ ATPase domain-containing protein [Tanacetum coccineum]
MASYGSLNYLQGATTNIIVGSQGATTNIIVGSQVWVEDPSVAWIDGEVLNIKGEEAEIQTTDGKKKLYSWLLKFAVNVEAPAGGVDDMTKLSYLHEPGVLQNLATRYQLNEIYTYTGNILIAVNPFKKLTHLYDAKMMERYKGTAIGELDPHVFAIADSAFRAMVNEGKSNSILVSGESGAVHLQHAIVIKMSAARIQFWKPLERMQKTDIEKYHLGDPKSFRYLNQSTSELMSIDGVKRFPDDYLSHYKPWIIGGMEMKTQEQSSGASISIYGTLTWCDIQALEDALLKRMMVTPEEVIKRSLDPEGAIVSRDGLAKTLYSRLFDWLVEKINVSIGQDRNSRYLIGVLDIYGFESFKSNSFEQFCINYTNEKLQQHFNQHVFKTEQEEYSREQIDWSYIEFIDNKDVLDLIEKKPGGIIALLDEACMFPKSTHETFSQKLYQTFRSHQRFFKPKLSRTGFTIAHYAGEVQYQSEQFLDKNKDYVVPEHQDMLTASKCFFISGLFPPLPDEATKSSNKSSKFSSIGARFKLQLQQLMETLSSTEPHYIRCVKPNNYLKPGIFESVNIMQQLRCGGVLEAIRISCAGYPTRKSFSDFVNRFSILAPEVRRGNLNAKDACKRILDKAGLQGSQIGKTKVFLRAGQMAELDARKAQKLSNAAKIIRRRIRTHIARKHFLALRKSAVVWQSFCRGKLAFKLYQDMQKDVASLRIQTNFRRHLSRKSYNKLKLSVILFQARLRSMVDEKRFRNRQQVKAAILLQVRVLTSNTGSGGKMGRAHWRGHRDYSYYKKLIKAAVITQCRWKRRIARKELRKLKMAARETTVLQQAKDTLEKQVEDLTLHLESEKRLKTLLEKAKDQEIQKVQKCLQAMQSSVSEANSLHVKERESAQKAIEEKDQEILELKNFLKSMQSNVEESNRLLIKERESAEKAIEELKESKDQEIQKLLSKADEINALLVKEREFTEKAIAEANVAKDLEIQRLQNKFDETKELLIKERDSVQKATEEVKRIKDSEIQKLQNSLQSMQNKVDETNELLLKERDNLQKAIDEAKEAKDLEIQRLQNSLQSMQNKFDETNALLVKESESLQKAIEEAKEVKDQEIQKLQNSLQDTQSKLDETNALLVKERESARKAIEEASRIKEIPVSVEDTEKITNLTTAVKNLKALSEWERQRADESERKFTEALESSENNRLKLEESERRVFQLQESLDSFSSRWPPMVLVLFAAMRYIDCSLTSSHYAIRLEDKLADIESQNRVLRQPGSSKSQNSRFQEGYSISIKDLNSPSAHSRDASDTEERLKKPLDERHENYDLLTRCITQRLGFSKGRPVTACIIYKCLRKWRSFEAEKTSIFDRIIQAIGRGIELPFQMKTQDNSDVLAYWLSNASTLLLLLQYTLKACGTAGDQLRRRVRSAKRTQSFRGSPHGVTVSSNDGDSTGGSDSFRPLEARYPALLFKQQLTAFRGSPHGVTVSSNDGDSTGGSDSFRPLEARYPALLFKQQLTAYVEKTFGLIRDNLKREISPLLGLCIQAPRIPKSSLTKGTARALANAASHEILLAQWQGIVTKLGCLLNTLKANYVPPFLIRQVFIQIFAFINVQLFNSLLLRRECCSYSNGEYVRSGLAMLERWCYKATEEVIQQKPKIRLIEISHDLCPMLSIQQLYRISTMYWDDKNGTHNLSPEVISNMRILMTQDSSNPVSNNSFLLDDDSSIPFSTDDLTKSMDPISISDIDPPPLLRQSSGFNFLVSRPNY